MPYRAEELEPMAPHGLEIALGLLVLLAALVAVAAITFVLARAYARWRQSRLQSTMPTTRRDAPPRKR